MLYKVISTNYSVNLMQSNQNPWWLMSSHTTCYVTGRYLHTLLVGVKIGQITSEKGFPGISKFDDHAHMQRNLCTRMFRPKRFATAPVRFNSGTGTAILALLHKSVVLYFSCKYKQAWINLTNLMLSQRIKVQKNLYSIRFIQS